MSLAHTTSARPAALPARILCSGCGRPARAAAVFCPACGRSLAFMYRPLCPGQKARNYTVLRLLSRGGMGAIYLAADHDAFDRTVVIKQLLDYFDPADPRAVHAAQHRFREEARTLASLRHPGIPQIYTFFSLDVSNYMVMEYIEGPNLEQGLTRTDGRHGTVKGRAYEAKDVVRWGIGLCKVLEYLAQRRPDPVVHHDIKPANLVLDANTGEVRLVDFGTARARLLPQQGGRVGLRQSSIYGTVGYAPPEQYGGVSEPRSDVYALAATLYHLLTDEDPRAEPFSFPRLGELPPRLRAALAPALELDVAKRCSASQLRAALAGVGERRPAQLAVAPPAVPAVEQWRASPIDSFTTLRGHTAAVRGLAWSPDGHVLASASNDGTIKLWSEDGTQQHALAGHGQEVLCATWNPPGNFLASGGSDGTIRFWRPDGSAAGAIGLGSHMVSALAWHPSGAPVAAGSSDGLVHLWSRDRALPGTLAGHTDRLLSLAWSPDGSTLVSGAADGTIRQWAMRSGKQQAIRGHSAAVWGLAWSPDGETFASASEDGTLRLWWADGTPRNVLRGHGAAVSAVAWSPDGALIASGGWDNVVVLWDGAGKLRTSLAGHVGAVRALAWHSHSHVLASGSWDGEIRLWRRVTVGAGDNGG